MVLTSENEHFFGLVTPMRILLPVAAVAPECNRYLVAITLNAKAEWQSNAGLSVSTYQPGQKR